MLLSLYWYLIITINHLLMGYTIGTSFATFASALSKNKAKLKNNIVELEIKGLFGIQDYYMAVKVFAFLDSLKDEINCNYELKLFLTQFEYDILKNIGIINLFESLCIIDFKPKKSFKKSSKIFLPIFPLQYINIPHEQSIETSIKFFLNLVTCKVEKTLFSCFDTNIVYHYLVPILNKFIHVILKELIENVLVHSGKRKILFGITLFRETQVYGKPRRQSSKFFENVYCLDYVLYDNGEGIMKKFMHYLNILNNENFSKKYHSQHYFKNKNILIPIESRENNVLKNLFSGNLSIRKGRQSKGFYEIKKVLEWSNGLLNLRSGRSEVALRVYQSNSNISVDIEQHNKSNRFVYTPGVICSGLIPLYHLSQFSLLSNLLSSKTEMLKISSTFNNIKTEKFDDFEISFVSSKELSPSFFSSKNKHIYDRFSEIEVLNCIEKVTLINTKRKGKRPNNKPHFLNIDLGNNNNLNISFLSNFIQEIVKIDTQKKVINKLIFSNVSRSHIQALFSENASSFIKLNKSFIIFLDELDFPFFLGIDKEFGFKDGIPETLSYLIYNLSLKKKALNKSANNKLIKEELLTIIHNDHRNIFYMTDDEFKCYPILNLLQLKRKKRLRKIQENISDSKYKNYSYKLLNGKIVDKHIDFSNFFLEQQNLNDTSRYLLRSDLNSDGLSSMFICDQILTFKNNGIKLTSKIANTLNINNIIVIDEQILNFKSHIKDLQGCNVYVVINVIHEGDFENESYAKKTISLLKELKCNFKILSFINLSNYIPDHIKNKLIFVYNINEPDFIKKFPKVSCKGNLRVINYSSNKLKPNNFRKKLKASSSDEKKKVKLISYTNLELASEFWQLLNELAINDYYKGNSEIDLENNTDIFKNRRVRSLLLEYSANFLQTINYQIDIIFYVKHNISELMVNTVAELLPKKPLVFPITLENYGGKIIVSPSEIKEINYIINREFQSVSFSGKKNTLIIDDACNSGNVMFSTIGLISKFNINLVGVFVLFNNLSYQKSETIEAIAKNFFFIYRLHSYGKINRSLLKIEFEYISNTHYNNKNKSSLQLKYHNKYKELFRNITDKRNENCKLYLVYESFSKDTKIRHVVNRLLKNPNYDILSLKTRMIILGNFFNLFLTENNINELINILNVLVKNIQKSNLGNSLFILQLLNLLLISKDSIELEVSDKIEQGLKDILDKLLREQYKSDNELLIKMAVINCLAEYHTGVYKSYEVIMLIQEAIKKYSTNVEYPYILGCLSSNLTLFLGKAVDIYQFKREFKFQIKRNSHFIFFDAVYDSIYEVFAYYRNQLIHQDPKVKFESILHQGENSDAYKFICKAPGHEMFLNLLNGFLHSNHIAIFLKDQTDGYTHWINTVLPYNKPARFLSLDIIDEEIIFSKDSFNDLLIEDISKTFDNLTDEYQFIGIPLYFGKTKLRFYLFAFYEVKNFNYMVNNFLESVLSFYYNYKDELYKLVKDLYFSELGNSFRRALLLNAMKLDHPIDENAPRNKKKFLTKTFISDLFKNSEIWANKTYIYNSTTLIKLIDELRVLMVNKLNKITYNYLTDYEFEKKQLNKLLDFKITGENLKVNKFALRIEVLELVLMELLSNALTYGKEDIEIDLNISDNRLILLLSNDLDNNQSISTSKKGLRMCQNIIAGVGGQLRIFPKYNINRFAIQIKFPIVSVPLNL